MRHNSRGESAALPSRVRRVSLFLVKTIAMLLLFEKHLAHSNIGLILNPGGQGIVDQKTILTFDLYPYTGWHIQPNFHHKGDMPGTGRFYNDFDIKTGSMGYFIDFDLNDPPPKKKHEFRIILIGGSGAQGWGAQTNGNMFYVLLEKKLNEELKDTGHRFKIINLAMAGSTTYQNYIALNRFAHPLNPDFILSYSGRNDYAMPMFYQSLNDGFVYFDQLNAFVLASRLSEYPPSFRLLVKYFPNLFVKTNLGIALKLAFAGDYFIKRAQESYGNNSGSLYKSKSAFLHDVVMPQYIGALQSIKRDFMGIPIMVAWQSLGKLPKAEGEGLEQDYYNKMYERAVKDLKGYYNNEWYFINVHKMTENVPNIGMHLGNEQHQIVSDILALKLVPIIRKLLLHNKAKE